MLKRLEERDIYDLLGRIADSYRLRVPGLLDDGTRTLLPWDGRQISLFGEPPQRKPTAYFFPQTDPLLKIDPQGQATPAAAAEKPFALFGLDSIDLAALAFTDRFFSNPPPDDHYLRRRNGALLIGLTGYAGPSRGFLPPAKGNCDLELIACGEYWLARAGCKSADHWLADYPPGDQEQLAVLQRESAQWNHRAAVDVQQAMELLRQDMVPDSFWEEIASRCILCSGCNLACPTCTCFCVQDRQTATGTVRSRVWDSCQLDAFMREASGHNPLGTEALRTRRRIYHKLVADPERWGEPGCVLCGRCDRACPTGIGMFAVAKEIASRFAISSPD